MLKKISLGFLVVLSFLSGCASQTTASSDTSAMTLVFTNGRFLETESCDCSMLNWGGLEREWTWRQQLSGVSGEHSLSLTAGPNFVPHPLSAFSQEQTAMNARAERLLKSLAAMNFRALGVSYEDLQFGVAELKTLATQTPIAFVNANIVDKKSGTPLFAPFVEMEVAGTTLWVTGLSHRGTVAASTGATVKDPAASLKAVLTAHPPGDRMVIVLSSLDATEREALAQVPRVNLILGAVAGEEIPGVEQLSSGQLFMSPPNRGRAVVTLKMDVPKSAGAKTFFNAETNAALMAKKQTLKRDTKNRKIASDLKKIDAILNADTGSAVEYEVTTTNLDNTYDAKSETPLTAYVKDLK